MAKLFFYDLETTGLKFWKNGIHQISGCIEIDGDVKEEFNFHVKPNPACVIEDEALDVSGVTLEQINAYPDMNVVYNQVKTMLSKYVNRYNKYDKFFLVGFNNAPFDNQFFRAFFVQNYDNYFGSYFWSSAIDVMVLAANHLKSTRHTMEDFKLKTVANTLGVTVDESKLHDALYDIYLTRAVYRKINGLCL